MFIIDDNMFRLAKMQESLLKVDSLNREENLKKYMETVTEIDSNIFINFLEEIKHIDEHNHTLESELQFLEKIVDSYNQLNELQLNFKYVCELYGENDLRLSDLSQINIEYINNRLNTISGYLINIKNIEKNKLKLQELNEQLIVEEKKKAFLNNKLLELEEELRECFIKAEGRLIVSGDLQYTSVLSEYKELGFDVNEFLSNDNLLSQVISEYNKRRYETLESVRAAEVCYNSLLNAESKQILNEMKRENLLVKYQLTMLKILEVISLNAVEYDDFVNKREQLVDLIKYRVGCIDELGIRMSIDPFSRIQINKQLDDILSFSNNSKFISKLMKEISVLNSRIEEMVSKNDEYLALLNEISPLLRNRFVFDMDNLNVSTELNFGDMLHSLEIADNQVIGVRDISSRINMIVVKRKTEGVIRRVNKMIHDVPVHVETKKETVFVPELVIIPSGKETKTKLSNLNEEFILEDAGTTKDEIDNSLFVDSKLVFDINNVDSSMFETVEPFAEPIFFSDRLDEQKAGDSGFSDKMENLNVKQDVQEELPDVFWVVQDDENKDQVIPSFDEQIDKLLAVESNEDVKMRKRVA